MVMAKRSDCKIVHLTWRGGSKSMTILHKSKEVIVLLAGCSPGEEKRRDNFPSPQEVSRR